MLINILKNFVEVVSKMLSFIYFTIDVLTIKPLEEMFLFVFHEYVLTEPYKSLCLWYPLQMYYYYYYLVRVLKVFNFFFLSNTKLSITNMIHTKLIINIYHFIFIILYNYEIRTPIIINYWHDYEYSITYFVYNNFRKNMV